MSKKLKPNFQTNSLITHSPNSPFLPLHPSPYFIITSHLNLPPPSPTSHCQPHSRSIQSTTITRPTKKLKVMGEGSGTTPPQPPPPPPPPPEDVTISSEMETGSDQDDDFDFGDDSDSSSISNHSSTSSTSSNVDMGFGFAQVIPDKDIRKNYQTEFTVQTIQDIITRQSREVEQVSSLLGCMESAAATLLRFFKWNKDKLIEKYMDDPERVLDDAGVILDDAKLPRFVVVNTSGAKQNNEEFTCDICCNDDDNISTLSLTCNHRFCQDCYSQYLRTKIMDEGESRAIQCPEPGCRLIVDEKTVELVVDKPVLQKYQTLLLRTFVDDNEFLKWCPAPDCQYAIECHVPASALTETVPTVSCRCNHKWCFGCAIPDHQPIICVLAKKWLRKCQDDSETANWLAINTKLCTKCSTTIEKNGGCNHMTCKKCKYEFCWVCLGPWSEHGSQWYNCNRFEDKTSVDARDQQSKTRQALERYLHYYNRYANHDQSARLTKEFVAKTEVKMEELQKSSDMSWIEVQFMKKAVDVVMECRMTLKWTYAFAFYLHRDNNQTLLFEDNQRDLEMAVEQLTELLEKPIETELPRIAEFRASILDKTVYVGSRREVLLEDTTKGLLEGRWKYNVEM